VKSWKKSKSQSGRGLGVGVRGNEGHRPQKNFFHEMVQLVQKVEKVKVGLGVRVRGPNQLIALHSGVKPLTGSIGFDSGLS
jgi:hypothetical protein